jgi:hypothetical protein
MKRAEKQIRPDNGIVQRQDVVTRLLEDLFIFQALKSGVRREHIRAILSVTHSRISKINKGIKKVRKDTDRAH